MSAAVLLSGGVDSAYLGKLVEGKATAVFVDYGQPSALMERGASQTIARALGWYWAIVTVRPMPLGDMDTLTGACVVPARNLWLTSIAAAFGDEVWIGAAPQDQRDYEDCRLHFLASLDDAMRTIHRRLRWTNASREERVKWLKANNLLAMTWSCYGPGPEPCGECASCRQ